MYTILNQLNMKTEKVRKIIALKATKYVREKEGGCGLTLGNSKTGFF